MLTGLIIVTALVGLDLLATWYGRDTRDADDWFDHEPLSERHIFERQGR
jgi:hypothetical protein